MPLDVQCKAKPVENHHGASLSLNIRFKIFREKIIIIITQVTKTEKTGIGLTKQLKIAK